ncbi:hypothetical protein [Streptomyces sp. NPDC026659]|uniref:hypothetical protein n=1 Tax=Streptomyces sp. NPDC026659 TaxID=3155123 RepID=UPI0033E548A2
MAALRRAGRKRGIEEEAGGLQHAFVLAGSSKPPLVEEALGKPMLALLIQLEANGTAADDLAEAVEEVFPQAYGR